MRRSLVGACTLGLAVAAACSSEGPSSDVIDEEAPGKTGVLASDSPPLWIAAAEGERLAPLPAHTFATSTNFSSHDVCAQCHSAGDDALRDAKGRDVSPVGTWKASAMALAARDPYYLATFADELAARPGQTATVERTCTRCHAPEASAQLELEGSPTGPSFATLTSETSAHASLAREGVACTGCHQIDEAKLGTPASFTGGYVIGEARRIFGPYENPRGDFMLTIANFTPTYAPHVKRSALCATCHTVITKPNGRGPDFPEQVPYLEWLASSYANESSKKGEKAADCQDCHMPAADEDGATLSLAIAKAPADLAPRAPFRRHGFAGANVTLSRFAAADPAWFGAPVTKEEHEAQARANEAMLRTAATLRVLEVKREGGGAVIPVEVTNTTGHKFPTGYPSRRAFLHVKVVAGGRTIFESGRTDAFGRFVVASPEGDRLAEPEIGFQHFDVVEREDFVQVYESVPVTADGKVAHRPLDAARYAKDNRLLPHGFDRRNAYASYTAPVGVDADPGWGTSDVVTYRVADVPAGASVEVELLFQAVRPSDVDALAKKPTPAARALFTLAKAAPPIPVLVASARADVP